MTEADWRAATDPAPLLHLAADRLADRHRLLFMAGCLRRVWDLLTDDRFRRVVEAAEAVADGRAAEDDLAEAAAAVPPPGYPAYGPGGTRAMVGVVNFRELPDWCRATYHAVAAVPNRDLRAVAVYCSSAAGGYAGDRVAELHPAHGEIRQLRDDVRRAQDRAADLHHRGATRAHADAVAAVAALDRETDDRIRALRATIGTAGWAEREVRTAAERAAQAGLVRCLAGNLPRPVAADPDWLTPAVLELAAGIAADRAYHLMPVLADALEDAGCADPAVIAHCRTDPAHAPGCWVVEMFRPPGVG